MRYSLNNFLYAFILCFLFIPGVVLADPGYEASTFDLNESPDVNGIYCPTEDTYNGETVYELDGGGVFLFYGDFSGADEYWFLGTVVEDYGSGVNMRFFNTTANSPTPDSPGDPWGAIGSFPDSGLVVAYECGGGGGGTTTATTTTLTMLGTLNLGVAILITLMFIFVVTYIYNQFKPKKKWL